MLKNISGYQKRFSSLQPLRKRGEVLKRVGENKVKRKLKNRSETEEKSKWKSADHHRKESWELFQIKFGKNKKLLTFALPKRGKENEENQVTEE